MTRHNIQDGLWYLFPNSSAPLPPLTLLFESDLIWKMYFQAISQSHCAPAINWYQYQCKASQGSSIFRHHPWPRCDECVHLLLLCRRSRWCPKVNNNTKIMTVMWFPWIALCSIEIFVMKVPLWRSHCSENADKSKLPGADHAPGPVPGGRGSLYECVHVPDSHARSIVLVHQHRTFGHAIGLCAAVVKCTTSGKRRRRKPHYH